MKRSGIFAALMALCTLGTSPAIAEEFTVVSDREQFLSLITGRELTRMGIRLEVSPGGEISGRAFGTPVTGAWDWNGNYFCRDLYYGEEDLGPNCQQVAVNGNTLRFTSDRGTGRYADLRLR
ncbi:MAG: dihydrodipicolinate reductase [Pseudomonadota bacterium]